MDLNIALLLPVAGRPRGGAPLVRPAVDHIGAQIDPPPFHGFRLAYGSEQVIDLHCHVLPGIDDGPTAIEGSVAIARAAAAAGIETLVATPHVAAQYPNDADTIASLVAELSARLAQERIPVTVLPGAEIAITHLPKLDPSQLSLLGLGGGPWLLVEPPFSPVAPGLEATLLDLCERGHRLVLAHPERCAALQRDHAVLRSLADAGVLMSITAGSLVGRFGGEVRRHALAMAQEGLIHNVTSDAHDAHGRAPGLAEELERAGMGALTEWLTVLVPAAVVADRPIPPAPEYVLTARRGPRLWRRRSR
jgi:protein-tyrosine phosphatase